MALPGLVIAVCMIGDTLLYAVLLWHRTRLEAAREQVEALKEQLGY